MIINKSFRIFETIYIFVVDWKTMGKTMGWRHIKVALLYLFCISIYVYIYFQIKPQALIKLISMNGKDQSTIILEQQRKMKRKMTLCANLFKLHQSNTKTNILRFETSSDHYVHNWYKMSIILLKGIFVGPTLYYHNPQLVDSRITCSQE